MKATGIVRRIDDLGRIVIPKEIRRTLRITEGDPIEIFLTCDGIVLKKYNCVQNTLDAVMELKDIIRDEDSLKNKPILLEKVKELEKLLLSESKE